MTVLMNYKRTVEDFKRCSQKAPTVYGLSIVSDCVGGESWMHPTTCPDLKEPVPCGDGKCHTDYVSCLRGLASLAESLAAKAESGNGEPGSTSSGAASDSDFAKVQLLRSLGAGHHALGASSLASSSSGADTAETRVEEVEKQQELARAVADALRADSGSFAGIFDEFGANVGTAK